MPGAELVETPELLRVATGLPIPSMNGAVRARMEPGAAEGLVAETVAYFRSRGLPMTWLVGPGSRPDGLGALLSAQGLQHLHDEPAMAADLAALRPTRPAPEDLRVERVDDEAALRDWCSFAGDPEMIARLFAWLMEVALGPSRTMVNFVARLGGRPVGTASTVLAAGVAGLYNVGVLPDVGRRGIGGAITLAALADAQAAGARAGVLHASAMGAPVYARLGFRTVGTVSFYSGK
jgi:GNAT superfamily N-acetyltransferase